MADIIALEKEINSSITTNICATKQRVIALGKTVVGTFSDNLLVPKKNIIKNIETVYDESSVSIGNSVLVPTGDIPTSGGLARAVAKVSYKDAVKTNYLDGSSSVGTYTQRSAYIYGNYVVGLALSSITNRTLLGTSTPKGTVAGKERIGTSLNIYQAAYDPSFSQIFLISDNNTVNYVIAEYWLHNEVTYRVYGSQFQTSFPGIVKTTSGVSGKGFYKQITNLNYLSVNSGPANGSSLPWNSSSAIGASGGGYGIFDTIGMDLSMTYSKIPTYLYTLTSVGTFYASTNYPHIILNSLTKNNIIFVKKTTSNIIILSPTGWRSFFFSEKSDLSGTVTQALLNTSLTFITATDSNSTNRFNYIVLDFSTLKTVEGHTFNYFTLALHIYIYVTTTLAAVGTSFLKLGYITINNSELEYDNDGNIVDLPRFNLILCDSSGSINFTYNLEGASKTIIK